MHASIIIISRTYSERMDVALAAIERAMVTSKEIQKAELVIVCDGGSLPGEFITRLKSSTTNLHLVMLPGLGRAAARNAGASVASGKRLIFLDGDMIVSSADLFIMVSKNYDSQFVYRGAIIELLGAAVAPSLAMGGPGFAPLTSEMIFREEIFLHRYRQGSSLLERAVKQRYENGDAIIPPWIAALGGFFAIGANLYRSLGGQAESFGRGWGCEDLEFAHRVIRQGNSIVYLPNCIGYHLSHMQPNRWDCHSEALRHFEQITGDPSVKAISALLGPNGSVDSYRAALNA